MSSITTSISFPRDLIDLVDQRRGPTSRSEFVCQILAEHLEGEQEELVIVGSGPSK